MKINSVLFIVVCCLSYFSLTLAESHSILVPRSITHNATYELGLDNYHIYHHPNDSCSIVEFYVTPFYAQSANCCDMARYFLPDNACSLNIQEDGSGNIGSLWLDLIAAPGLSFSSTLSIAPQRKVVGGYFYTRLEASRWLADSHWVLKNLWFSMSFAAYHVQYILNVQETLTGDMVYGTIPGITTGIQAFNNPAWAAGKLSVCPLKKTGVDDIQLKLGDNWFFCDDQSHIGLYFVGSIPTGNRPNATFLFEPLVGTKHGAVGFGTNSDFNLYQGNNSQCNFMLDVKYRYLFSGCERRSFDLCENGDWSRYLLAVNASATSVSLPGINFATMPVQVTPRSQIEAWFALHYDVCNWNLEAGYNLWWRAADKINSCSQYPANTGIYDLAGAISGTPVSASMANITQSAIGPNKAPSDAVFTPSTVFNFSTGEQPQALTNTIYGAVSYNFNEYVCPWLIGFGGGYEFADHHALAQWSVWGKLGLAY